MNIPNKIINKHYTYQFVRKINDRLYMYEEEKNGWKECFHIMDLIKIQQMQDVRKGVPTRER